VYFRRLLSGVPATLVPSRSDDEYALRCDSSCAFHSSRLCNLGLHRRIVGFEGIVHTLVLGHVVVTSCVDAYLGQEFCWNSTMSSPRYDDVIE
jgi:hypothetical protein